MTSISAYLRRYYTQERLACSVFSTTNMTTSILSVDILYIRFHSPRVSESSLPGVKSRQHHNCRLHQIWTGSFSTVTEAQALISAGAHCWAPAASAHPGSRTVTVWWPPQPPTQDKSPSPAPPEPTEPASQQPPEFKSETLQILSRVGEAQPAKAEESGKKEKDLDRDWTVAEQLRHPVGIVGLQWTPGSLQRGQYSSHASTPKSATFKVSCTSNTMQCKGLNILYQLSVQA